MKNWIVNKREKIIDAILVVLLCAMGIGFTIAGVNDIKNTTYEFNDYVYDTEYSVEMTEAACELMAMYLAMED